MELARICQNCNYFFSDSKDFESGKGVCLREETFEPFMDEIMQSSSFTNCNDLYLEKRYDGEAAACLEYEEVEMIEASDEDDMYGYLLNETLKHQNVDGVLGDLHSADHSEMDQAITSLSAYIYIGNEHALEGLINYYRDLHPAISLEDVHIRLKIVKVLANRMPEKKAIDLFINELARTSSSQTTRQLYTEIIKFLRKCPRDLISEPLLQLLKTREYSHKLKKRIHEIIEGEEMEFWE